MTTTDNSHAAVRVCAIADIQCSRDCGTGPCKREREARYPSTDNSRADALTNEQIATIAEPYWNFDDQIAGYRTFDPVGFARAILAASPVEQNPPLMGTDRAAIQECIDYLSPAAKDFADLSMGDSKHARCIRTLRALLATSPVEQHEAAPANVLAHVKWLHYCLREGGRCIDGGKCHHKCDPKGECWRQDGSVPLTGSRLTDDWKLPAPSAPLEGTGNGADERDVLNRLVVILESGQAYNGIAHDNAAIYAKALRDLLESRAPRTEVAGAVPFAWIRANVPEHLASPIAYSASTELLKNAKEGYLPVYLAPQPPSADAAAAPADERAAFDAWFSDWHDPNIGQIEVRIEKYAAWSAWQARAAASQPAAAAGQEAVAWETTHPAVCTPLTKEPLVAAGWREQGWHVVPLYTAPPAQVATRQELTVRQRMDLLLVADDMEVSGDAKLANALRALLAGEGQ